MMRWLNIWNLVFYLLLLLGYIKPSGENNGEELYNVDVYQCHITGAYEGEIVRWLQTGEFQFDENCRPKWIE